MRHLPLEPQQRDRPRHQHERAGRAVHAQGRGRGPFRAQPEGGEGAGRDLADVHDRRPAPASKLFNCSHSQQVEEPPPAPTPGRNPENLESNITLFTSKSLEGPWTRYGTVLGPDYKGMWDEDTSNPSPWVLPNGVNTTACKRLFSLGCVPHTDGAVLQTVLLMYRGCTVFQPGCNGEYMGVASAPTWKGPYTRLLPRPILPKVYAEDPSM